jgi:hypothetical protein
LRRFFEVEFIDATGGEIDRESSRQEDAPRKHEHERRAGFRHFVLMLIH